MLKKCDTKYELYSKYSENMGNYSTEAKAIKVLDKIQNEYGKYIYGPGGKDALTGEMFQPMAFNLPKVFQMPSDEEVEA
jgi:hypothetical protein